MTSPTVQHFDVVIVGAGISGIGAGYHLQQDCPDRDYVILEGRDDLGGTWDLFRYPGVRSDSDMHTLGYSFKPWTEAKAIADGPSILTYVRETAAEFGIDQKMRFQHMVTDASWSSETSTWTVTAQVGAEGDKQTVAYTCNYLFMCSGYYSYKGGYEPEFPGRTDFAGPVVHPQKWPEDLDYEGKRVVVIGSGATAMTLVPAMATTASHVMMLQRSPTYVVSRPAVDPIANGLRKVLPDSTAYGITRWRNATLGEFFYKQTRTKPDKMREKLLKLAKKELGDETVAEHFTPEYNPWDQRLCLIPDSDLYNSINNGDASVVTAEIDTLTATGILLTNGEHIDADIIVTATGLQLVTIGDMDFAVDGQPVDFSKTWTYKGIAYSDVPNMASSFGYINASWTLRADITCQWVCRLLNHMTESGMTQATPRLRPEDADMPERPFIDDFSAGYMARMMPLLPRQGDREPWINTQSYRADKKFIARAPIVDGVMRFGAARVPATTA
ncbi:flavin-containing monooxygenase [Ilumatobacter sp.]|uniref:flavin-containing monooxygenase n=1 Tax=Ilumatobacter sp. TaxID=1967498 RepID=UPI002A2818C5|nr:NAD(P)/FAD-dependent oxidoreductase [Ilumatobacter sp.]MDG1695607.1 NAD(P)/FAD-dependent oxidoreductase [Ilumatobacter sp.]